MDPTTFSAFRDLVTSRRSVRRFAPKAVDPALITAVMEAIRFSPSPTNRMCFRFVGVTDPLLLQSMKNDVMLQVEEVSKTLDREAAETFREYARWFSFFDQAPLAIVGLFRVFASRLPGGTGTEPSIEGLAEVQAFGGAVHALMLGLHAQGLGSCWMSGPLIAESQIERLLHVERPWRVGAVIPVGWPEKMPAVPRKPELGTFFSWFPA
ncbi:MAG: nitroreductase [Candidatus Ozemobacter sibiricus]|jgi:nitroreductase|uniref:Nitroreductase n=1 Tax=Candidatus Ozemobacter sibiricus TaxID=2268124 RepID=A0A367ZV35_9BACT|nr:MAG: nitroreductase [Candidatus Ozemobacter sibiricus]